jgi:hypothetical protein
MYGYGKVIDANKETNIDMTYINARIATNETIKMVYVPKHKKGKETKDAKLLIPIMVNEFGKSEPEFFTLIATGNLADVFAKHFNKGKEMTFFCKSKTRIIGWLWGADSQTTIQEEILCWDHNDGKGLGIASGEGFRPEDWNRPGTQGNIIWRQMMHHRMHRVFNKQDLENGFFGFARVSKPGGKVIYEGEV